MGSWNKTTPYLARPTASHKPSSRKLREIVRDCIERHVDQQQLEVLRAAEKSEREILERWARIHRGEAP